MARLHSSLRVGSDRTSLYDDITGNIIAELEDGRIPWVQPWGSAGAKASLAMPNNAATGRRYSGINVLILWGAVIAHGFPGQGWLTFHQALAMGGHVRKGGRGTTVVYADRFIPDGETTTQDLDGDGVTDLTTTAVKTLIADGSTTTTTTDTNGDGLRDSSVSTTSADGLSTTIQSQFHGSVTFNQTETITTARASIFGGEGVDVLSGARRRR